MSDVAWIFAVWREHGRRWEPARARAAMLSVLSINYGGSGKGFGQS